jgi:hypothetical protein
MRCEFVSLELVIIIYEEIIRIISSFGVGTAKEQSTANILK